MTPGEARSLAVAIARRIGVIEDPLYVEQTRGWALRAVEAAT